MFPGLSAPLTLTWLDEQGETKGVSAPLDVWVAQIVLVLPADVQAAVMDNVVSEVIRLNELLAEEAEAAEAAEELEEEENDEDTDWSSYHRPRRCRGPRASWWPSGRRRHFFAIST